MERNTHGNRATAPHGYPAPSCGLTRPLEQPRIQSQRRSQPQPAVKPLEEKRRMTSHGQELETEIQHNTAIAAAAPARAPAAVISTEKTAALAKEATAIARTARRRRTP